MEGVFEAPHREGSWPKGDAELAGVFVEASDFRTAGGGALLGACWVGGAGASLLLLQAAGARAQPAAKRSARMDLAEQSEESVLIFLE